MPERFRERRIAWLFYAADNLSCVAGHRRIFGDRPGRGFTIYRYNQINKAYAFHRVWSLWLIALHHIGEGLSTSAPGWHLTFAGIKFKRIRKGFSIQWHSADLYNIPPKKVKRHVSARPR